MKIYSNNKTLSNSTVDIYGEKVQFDKFGIANVENEVGEKILELAPNAYSKDPYKSVAPIKDKDSDQLKLEVEALKITIEKLKISNESKKVKIGEKESEVKDVRIALENVNKEKEDLQFKIEQCGNLEEKESEDWKTRYELALQGLTELKAICKSLEISDSNFKEIKDKKEIINLIVEKSKD